MNSLSLTPHWFIDVVVSAVLLWFGYRILRSAYPRREHYWYKLRTVAVIEFTCGSAYLLAMKLGGNAVEAFLFGLLAAAIVSLRTPRRRRYVSASIRRKAIARFELKTGKKYNPKMHELDHVIPFSRGGSNTLDNICVVEKNQNRSKGSNSPSWDLFRRRR